MDYEWVTSSRFYPNPSRFYPGHPEITEVVQKVTEPVQNRSFSVFASVVEDRHQGGCIFPSDQGILRSRRL